MADFVRREREGEDSLGTELAVKVDLTLGDVVGEVCGKRQHDVSACTRKRKYRSQTCQKPH